MFVDPPISISIDLLPQAGVHFMLKRRSRSHHESIYKNAYRAFFGICMRYCKSKEDAEETFNDSMIKYFNYEKKEKIKEESRYALIKKIITNSCIDRLRKRKMHFEEIKEEVMQLSESEFDLEYQGLKEELLAGIQRLPPNTQLVFNLYIFEGLSHQEIAKKLEITENTSSWHLNEGKKRMLRLLTQNPV